MAKLVVFSSGFPSAPAPSTLAEPTALKKMRNISHHWPGPQALSFFFFFKEKCLNTYQAPGAETGWRLESKSSDTRLSSWGLWDEAGKGAAALSKAKQLVLTSEMCWIFLLCPQPALGCRERNEFFFVTKAAQNM